MLFRRKITNVGTQKHRHTSEFRPKISAKVGRKTGWWTAIVRLVRVFQPFVNPIAGVRGFFWAGRPAARRMVLTFATATWKWKGSRIFAFGGRPETTVGGGHVGRQKNLCGPEGISTQIKTFGAWAKVLGVISAFEFTTAIF